MKRASSLLIAGLFVIAGAALADASNLVGKHTITLGKSHDGKTYKGSVAISKLGDAHLVRWKTTAGSYGGIGIDQGDELFVGWGADKEPFGVVVYQLGKGGVIKGSWTTIGDGGKLGSETGMGGSKGDFGGTYRIVGANPGGKGKYKGTLSIVKTGETYQLTWTVGKSSYRGVGIRSGNKLGVGWGMKQFGVVHYKKAGDGWDGHWALPGQKKLSTENLD